MEQLRDVVRQRARANGKVLSDAELRTGVANLVAALHTGKLQLERDLRL